MGELEFKQRWGLRRNGDDGLDSPFDGSKSSSGQLPKKQKLVSNLISIDDDDDESSGFKVKGNDNPGRGDHVNTGKAKKCKTRNVSNKLQNNKLKRDCLQGVDLNKDDTSVDHVAAPLDQLKSLMESLLKDHKVTREDLLKWMLEEMQKLVADFIRLEPKRRKRGHGGENMSIPANPHLQTSSDQDVKVVQSDKSVVVLAIEAQKAKGESMKRTAKGKKAVDHNDHHQVPEDQGKSTNGEKFGSSVVRNFLPSLPGQTPLSSVPTEPIVANHDLDASCCKYIPPSSNQGLFQSLQPDERTRSFALLGSKNMDSFNLNSPSASCIGTGFSVPFHQAMDVGPSFTRETNPQYLSKDHNSKPSSLMMNGGSYNLPQLIASNDHHHSYPAYKHDGSFMSYLMQNIKDGILFRQ